MANPWMACTLNSIPSALVWFNCENPYSKRDTNFDLLPGRVKLYWRVKRASSFLLGLVSCWIVLLKSSLFVPRESFDHRRCQSSICCTSSTARRLSLSVDIFLLNPLCRCSIEEHACFTSSMTSSKNSLFIPTLLVRKWTACFRFSLRSTVHLYCAILWYYSPSSVGFVKSLTKRFGQIWSCAIAPRQIPAHVDTGNLSRCWQLVQLHWVKSLNQRLPKPSLLLTRLWKRMKSMRDVFHLICTKVRAFLAALRKTKGEALGFLPGLLFGRLRWISSGL